MRTNNTSSSETNTNTTTNNNNNNSSSSSKLIKFGCTFCQTVRFMHSVCYDNLQMSSNSSSSNSSFDAALSVRTRPSGVGGGHASQHLTFRCISCSNGTLVRLVHSPSHHHALAKSNSSNANGNSNNSSTQQQQQQQQQLGGSANGGNRMRKKSFALHSNNSLSNKSMKPVRESRSPSPHASSLAAAAAAVAAAACLFDTSAARDTGPSVDINNNIESLLLPSSSSASLSYSSSSKPQLGQMRSSPLVIHSSTAPPSTHPSFSMRSGATGLALGGGGGGRYNRHRTASTGSAASSFYFSNASSYNNISSSSASSSMDFATATAAAAAAVAAAAGGGTTGNNRLQHRCSLDESAANLLSPSLWATSNFAGGILLSHFK